MNKDSLTMAAQVREYLEKEGYAPPDKQGWQGQAELHATAVIACCAPKHPAQRY